MKIGRWTITCKDGIWFIICLLIIISFFSGLLCQQAEGAADVVSGASTVVSIVLSAVAILYTMIEGANSAAINQSTISKLDEIDIHLKEAMDKIEQSKDIGAQIKLVLPDLLKEANVIQNAATNSEEVPSLNPETIKKLESLQKFFEEDFAE